MPWNGRFKVCWRTSYWTACTLVTSGMRFLRKFSTPHCRVIVDIGHPLHAPFIFTFTMPLSNPTNSMSPPSACNCGLTCSRAFFTRSSIVSLNSSTLNSHLIGQDINLHKTSFWQSSMFSKIIYEPEGRIEPRQILTGEDRAKT
jgi:hypothetical protein